MVKTGSKAARGTSPRRRFESARLHSDKFPLTFKTRTKPMGTFDPPDDVAAPSTEDIRESEARSQGKMPDGVSRLPYNRVSYTSGEDLERQGVIHVDVTEVGSLNPATTSYPIADVRYVEIRGFQVFGSDHRDWGYVGIRNGRHVHDFVAGYVRMKVRPGTHGFPDLPKVSEKPVKVPRVSRSALQKIQDALDGLLKEGSCYKGWGLKERGFHRIIVGRPWTAGRRSILVDDVDVLDLVTPMIRLVDGEEIYPAMSEIYLELRPNTQREDPRVEEVPDLTPMDREALGRLLRDIQAVNPKDQVGRRKPQIGLVPPSAIIEESVAFADGAEKYGPFNWREKTVGAMTYVHACLRHLYAWVDGEEECRDSTAHHLAAARACLGILLDARSIGKLLDDRPSAGAAADLIEAASAAYNDPICRADADSTGGDSSS